MKYLLSGVNSAQDLCNYILMGDFEMASIWLVCGYPWKPMFAIAATNDTICVYVGRNFHYTLGSCIHDDVHILNAYTCLHAAKIPINCTIL